MALFHYNTPHYFDPSEAREFERYLEQGREDYYVLEGKGTLSGCGGINAVAEVSITKGKPTGLLFHGT